MKTKAVIFDLDNTLYDESLYFREVIVRSADSYSLNKERMLSCLDSGILHASNDIFGDGDLYETNLFSKNNKKITFSAINTEK